MTAIEWTDRTWNPVVGCTKVSAGCKNCYAKTEWDRRHKGHLAGKKVAPQYAQPFEVVQLKPERLAAPLRWRKPAMVFVNSVSDLFHEDVPFDYIDRVFAVMALTPQHTYQVLTKRPERMREYVQGAGRWALVGHASAVQKGSSQFVPAAWPLPNVWLGTSVEDQAAADARIQALRGVPAAVRFLSCEPLLGSLNLFRNVGDRLLIEDVDWVIVGGESGPNARPTDIEHIRTIAAHCQAAGVPVFVKQLGARPVGLGEETCDQCFYFGTGGPRQLHGSDCSGRQLHDRKGGAPEEWPEDLRVRQFPEVRRAS